MFFGLRHHVYARKPKHFFGHFETPPPYRVTGKGGGASGGHKVVTRWSHDGHQVVTWWSESQNYDQCLRPKYLGLRYTIPQTFQPFGYHIFKIPKRRIQLRFLLKLEPVTWDHVSHVDTWSQAFLASSMPDWGFYKGYEYEYFQAQNLMMMMMMMRGGWDTLHQTLIYGQTEKNEYSSNKT